MNKYQKIALIVGVIVLFLAFGKTITKIGFMAITSLGALFLEIFHYYSGNLFDYFVFKESKKKKMISLKSGVLWRSALIPHLSSFSFFP